MNEAEIQATREHGRRLGILWANKAQPGELRELVQAWKDKNPDLPEHLISWLDREAATKGLTRPNGVIEPSIFQRATGEFVDAQTANDKLFLASFIEGATDVWESREKGEGNERYQG